MQSSSIHLPCFFQLTKDRAAVSEQHMARLGHGNPPAETVKQRCTQLMLQQLDLLAKRRLSHAKLVSGACEMQAMVIE